MDDMDYDRIAERYDVHRNADEDIPRQLLEWATGAAFENKAEKGWLIDLGCGTGNVTRWLHRLWGGRVLGVDRSAGMLSKASRKLSGVPLLKARAEALPFKSGSITAAVGSFFLHHLNAQQRRNCLKQVHRLLKGAGVEHASGVAILTASHAQIRTACLSKFFPSFADLDCARFPRISDIQQEMLEAGFVRTGSAAVSKENRVGDRRYVAKVKDRFISTLDLIPEKEFSEGVKRMERLCMEQGSIGDVTWNATIVYAGM